MGRQQRELTQARHQRHGQRLRAGGLAPAAAVEVAADPADRHAGRDQRRHHIRQLPTGDAELPQHEPPEPRIAEQPAEHGPVDDDAAVPDLHKLLGEADDVRRVLIAVLQHVDETRPGDAGDEENDGEIL